MNQYQIFASILSADILAMFVKRFTSQFDQLKQLIFKLKAMLKTPRHHHHLTEDEEEEEEDEDYLTRDNFNIHKMIVATTAAGKVWCENQGFSQPSAIRQLAPDFISSRRFSPDYTTTY